MKIRLRWLIAPLGLLALPSAAQARGIDCRKAATPLEKTICADEAMLGYDARIATAYASALTAFKGAIAAYVRKDQADWLTRFRDIGPDGDAPGCTIDDKACIREDMRNRVDQIESGTYVHSGVYLAPDGRKLLLHPRRANDYALRIFKPETDANIASLDEISATLWDGPNALVTKMGDANGLPLPKADGCKLRLVPAALAITVTQTGKCAGHSYAGTYRRDLAQTLWDYEFDLH